MEESAAQTLDQVREGATVLVLASLDRLREAGEEVRQGHFIMAQERCREAQMKLTPLAQAEAMVTFAGGYLTRARDVREGVTLVNIGTVTSRTDGDGDPRTVQLEFDNGQSATFVWDSELLAVDDASAP